MSTLVKTVNDYIPSVYDLLSLVTSMFFGGKKITGDHVITWSLLTSVEDLYKLPHFFRFRPTFNFLEWGIKWYTCDYDTYHAVVKDGNLVQISLVPHDSAEMNQVIQWVPSGTSPIFNATLREKDTGVVYDVTDVVQRLECMIMKCEHGIPRVIEVLPLIMEMYNIRFSQLHNLELAIVLDDTFDTLTLRPRDYFQLQYQPALL